MTETELLIDFHKDGQRQGPGSSADTLRALDLTGSTFEEGSSIADIGCGTGAQTIELARSTRGMIHAVDLFPVFLDKLHHTARTMGMENRIKTRQASMDNLPFEKESLDLIWSEGAIYNMGFESGIAYWRQFLKPGGYLAVSEITWITGSRPKEIEDFWSLHYPEIGTAGEKIQLLEANGYSLCGYFMLSQQSWLDEYYRPMEDRFSIFLERHANSESAQKLVSEHREELNLYQNFKNYYSYGFYVACKK